MADSKASKIFDASVAGSSTTEIDVPAGSTTKLAVLFVMDNATAAGDLGAVVLKLYRPERPQEASEIVIPVTATIGPILTGAVAEKLVRYDVSEFTEARITIVNGSAGARDLRVFGFFGQSG